MPKKLIAALCAFALAMPCGAVFAEEEIPAEESAEAAEAVRVEQTAEEKIELSLEEAISSALSDNPQIEAADAKIKSAELTLEVTKMTQKDFNKFYKEHPFAIDVSDSMNTAYLKEEYYPAAAQTQLDLATQEREKVQAQIIYDVKSKYYNLKLLERLLEIAESSYQLTKDNADVVNKSFELGLVSNLEVQNVAAAVEQSQANIESYKRNILLATDSLKISMGREDEEGLYSLTDDISLPEMPENLEQSISSAMETRYDVTALKKAFELQSLAFEITGRYATDNTATYHTAYADYVSAKYNYENNSKLIALSIRSEYSDILTAKESIQNAENALKVKEIEYNSDKIKYEIGSITNLDLTQTMTELEGCRVQLENAHLTYMLAVEKYNCDITIGI